MAIIQKKGTVYASFLLTSLVAFAILFIFGMMIRDVVFNELFATSQFTIISMVDLLTIYIVIYILWNILLMFLLLGIINMVMAKVLNIELGKVFAITIISLLIAILLFHITMYLWLLYANPFGSDGYSQFTYLIDFYTYTGHEEEISEFNDLMELFGFLFDYLYVLFYMTYFSVDPSLTNYLIMYFLGKLVVSDAPFQFGGYPFNPFFYETWFILLFYFPIFTLFFWRFVNSCECVTEAQLQAEAEEEQISVFGEKDENVIGRVEFEKRTSKSLIND